MNKKLDEKIREMWSELPGFRRCGKLFGLVFEFPKIGGDQDNQCTEDEDAAGVLADHAQREWRV